MNDSRDPDQVDLNFDWQQDHDVTFNDIGGNEEVKQALQEDLITPLDDPDLYFQRFNIEPVRGILLHGPPGTGKTMLGRAIANELDRPFVEVNQSKLTSQVVNEGPQLVSRIFEEAQYLRGVVFIDEAEQLLSDRGGENSHQMDEKLVNTFLSELGKENKEFVIILTTNRRDLIDEAVLRPGRIDAEFEIDVPDRQGRADIMKKNLEDIPHDLDNDDVKELVAKTEGWSGADIESLIGQAKRTAAKNKCNQLTIDHIDTTSVDRTASINSDFDTNI